MSRTTNMLEILSLFIPIVRLGALPERVKSKEVLGHVFDQTRMLLQHDPGLLATSVYETTLQWDWPNGWPPLQYVALRAMQNIYDMIGDRSLLDLANVLAQRNLASAFCSWYKTGGSIPGILRQFPGSLDAGHMFEKFDVRYMGLAGSGGECKYTRFNVVITDKGWY